MSEASEREGILSGLLLSERSEVGGKSGVYYIIRVNSEEWRLFSFSKDNSKSN